MYQHFTEYRIHESLSRDTNDEYVVVVEKQDKKYCMFITSDGNWTLSRALTHLDRGEDAGWLIDEDVGAHIATYSVTTHPELFI